MYTVTPRRVVCAALVVALCQLTISCGGGAGLPPAPPPAAVCEPSHAKQVLSISLQNQAGDDLRDYPVAIAFDSTTFDFAKAAADGSDLALWDAASGAPLPFWLEAYDKTARRGLIWTKVSALPGAGSPTLWLTSGALPHCSPSLSNGYGVFPFFSDVNDAAGWAASGHLQVTDTITSSPFTVQERNVIVSDGAYNSTPGVAEAANGDWVLAYRKGTGHIVVPNVILRRSTDQGKSWSPEVAYFNTPGTDPTVMRTPGGDLILELIKKDAASGLSGSAYTRSVDNGVSWSPFTFLDQPVDRTAALPTLWVNDGTMIYAVGYGPSSFDDSHSPFFFSSSDDGLTWNKGPELRVAGDPGANESALAKIGSNGLLTIMRTDDNRETYGRFSSDVGATWGPLVSYTSQVGVLQLPQLIQAGSALLLLGRETSGLKNAPGLPQGAAQQLAVFVSYDEGQNFAYGTVLEDYTGAQVDGGYCWPLLMNDGRVFVVYYADSQNLRKPDIKSLVLKLDPPQASPSSSLHISNRAGLDLAAHSLDLSATRYSVEFRFRSREIPIGTQFAVDVQGMDANQQPVTLVNWELPSTQAADPGNFSGINANNQFLPILDTFNYDHNYRIRTLVDENQQTQEGEVLDSFGALLDTSGPQPLAQGLGGHVANLLIGNHSDRRATDTMLDFIFVRPVAAVEPQVTVSRLR